MRSSTADGSGVVDAGSPFDLRGRRVLVTGAGRGLGRGIALAVAAAGGHVVAVARTAEHLLQTATAAPYGHVVPLPWDLRAIERSDELIERASELGGPVDSVVHVAGVQFRAAAEDFTLAQWRGVTSVDLEAPFFLSTALHRTHLAGGRAGAHLFIGSLTSSIGLPRVSAYAASKSGLAGLTRSLAVEWAPMGSRVNCIAPGYFHTDLTADLFSDPERSAWVLGRIPMGRLGVAADLGGAAVFLLSDAASYVTGQLLSVDGGWLAG